MVEGTSTGGMGAGNGVSTKGTPINSRSPKGIGWMWTMDRFVGAIPTQVYSRMVQSNGPGGIAPSEHIVQHIA